jgi:hypothetical protein
MFSSTVETVCRLCLARCLSVCKRISLHVLAFWRFERDGPLTVDFAHVLEIPYPMVQLFIHKTALRVLHTKVCVRADINIEYLQACFINVLVLEVLCTTPSMPIIDLSSTLSIETKTKTKSKCASIVGHRNSLGCHRTIESP